MTALRHAFAFLTIFPVGPANQPPTAWASSFFPLVGLALGGILACLDFILSEALPMPVVGAVLLAALLILTRAIHTEGFLDSCDGLLGGRSRSEKLRILRGSHVGAFAVIGCVSLLMLKWALLAGGPNGTRTELLVLFPGLSRFGMLCTMSAFSYVRKQGLGTSFTVGRRLWQPAVGLVIASVASVLLLGVGGLALLGTSLFASMLVGWWVSRLIGGMTGDTYGAINELAEVVVLLSAAVFFHLATNLFGPPLW